ncbi:intraflagellar transport protein 22 homolog [Dermacentor silvarum]|uniref:intraflagellar transport protein 22 homolog n=1 Tax=Dermacentor silvarum TaxID=543639 RepID=UPI001897D8AA|nr:intraflagellar transport protein 22 homolog [Dermacentor silvarum]
MKIIVIGPCQSGKTAISNYLAEATENSSGQYQPTKGVRILEFESPQILVKGRQTTTPVELWDCSGDQKYENCWPAFAKDTQGIVFVYSSDQKNVSTALDVWYNNFVQSQGVRDSQCVVFCHRKSSDRPAGNPSQLSHLFARITWVSTNIDDTEDGGKGGEQTRHEFNKFLERLSNELNERHDQEELSIIGQA